MINNWRDEYEVVEYPEDLEISILLFPFLAQFGLLHNLIQNAGSEH